MRGALEIDHLTAGYGRVPVLHGVTVDVVPGEVVALIGPNGSGKSTTLRAASGLLKPTGGHVRLDGRDVTGWSSDRLARLGLAHVLERRGIFPELTVSENLRLGSYLQPSSSRRKAAIARMKERFPVLASRPNQRAGSLSGGEQQQLAIARALVAEPKWLLLDEPSLGLAPLLVAALGDVIRWIANNGVAVLLVEQNASLAFAVALRCYVLETGNIIDAGPTDEVRSQPSVMRSFLGMDTANG